MSHSHRAHGPHLGTPWNIHTQIRGMQTVLITQSSHSVPGLYKLKEVKTVKPHQLTDPICLSTKCLPHVKGTIKVRLVLHPVSISKCHVNCTPQ